MAVGPTKHMVRTDKKGQHSIFTVTFVNIRETLVIIFTFILESHVVECSMGSFYTHSF